jgi:hypothetical protein
MMRSIFDLAVGSQMRGLCSPMFNAMSSANPTKAAELLMFKIGKLNSRSKSYFIRDSRNKIS